MQLALDDEEAGGGSGAEQFLEEGYINAIYSSHDRCVGDLDPIEAYNILGYGAEYQLLGFDGDGTMSDEIMELMERCLRFELTFESEYVQQYSSENDVTNEATVRAENIPLILGEDGLQPFEADGPIRWMHFYHHERDCYHRHGSYYVADWTLTDSTLRAWAQLGLNYTPAPPPETDPDAPFDPCAPVPDPELPEALRIDLYLDPGDPKDVVSWECYDDEDYLVRSGVNDFISTWTTLFFLTHFDEHFVNPFGEDNYHIEITDIRRGEEIFARKVYDREMEVFFAPLIEGTRIEIRHTPAN